MKIRLVILMNVLVFLCNVNFGQSRLKITEIQILNKSIKNFQKSASGIDSISLNWNQSVFTINFFSNLDKIDTLFYTLQGFDNTWKKLINKHNVTYTNLKPGVYTFIIKRLNFKNIGNDVSTLKIYIKKPYWQNIYYKIAMTFIFLSLIYLVILLLKFIFFRK